MPQPQDDAQEFKQLVNNMLSLMRRMGLPSVTIEMGDRPPSPPPSPHPAGIGGVMLKLLGEDPQTTADRLKAAMAARHAAGASFLLPDGEELNRIKVGKKFPDNFYIQHDQEAVWLVRRLMAVAGREVCHAVEGAKKRLACMDGYNREFINPAVAANDARRGYVCIELRSFTGASC